VNATLLVQSLRMVLALTVVTGGLYPVAVMTAGRLLFHDRSLGSRVTDSRGRLLGSSSIGQPFTQPRYFWGRPSAAGTGYDGQRSSGTNLSPVAADHVAKVRAERDRLVGANPDALGEPPLLLLTSSASGLDPHVSPEAALWQAPRVAKARGIAPARLRELIEERTEGRTLGCLGEPRVNVLELNLELDRRWP
jgi:K+-transporting ATPase ATPase C chain